jgi:MFS family permease
MREKAYKNYLLTLLLLILAFNYVDRLTLGLLLQEIKFDLDLSDTQLGLLSGIAFALFYSLMGVPIARWADRGNRVTIISVTTGLWCVAVAACGAATSFLQLLLIRTGVAVGEAGCIPPAHSLIADHFSRAERPRAVARYMMGAPLSAIIGYFMAGWLNELYGWRATFVILGLPGIGLAALAWLTLREPRKLAAPSVPASQAPTRSPMPAGMREVCVALWANRTYRHLLFCFSAVSFFSYGIVKWQPAFFIRSHGLQTGELGTWLAVIYGLGGIVGMYCGGEWASRRAAQDERLQLRALSVAYVIFGFVSVLAYLAPNRYLAFAWMTVAAIGGATTSGPLFATIQALVPQRMRATSIAILYLFANLIGMGLGPLAVGFLSDVLQPRFGAESLRYALLMFCPGYLWGAFHAWRGSQTVTADLQGAGELA